MYSKLSKNIIVVAQILALILVSSLPVQAITPEEELALKQAEIEKLEKEMQKVEEQLGVSNKRLKQSQSDLQTIKLEIVALEKEILLNEIKAKKLHRQIEFKELEKFGAEQQQAVELRDAYINWKSKKNAFLDILGGEGEVGFLKTVVYHQLVAENTKASILGIFTQIEDLNSDYTKYNELLVETERQRVLLADKQKLLKQQVADLDRVIIEVKENSDGVRSRLEQVQQEADQLEAILENENGGGNGGTQPLISGELYFEGTAIVPAPPADVSYDAFGHGLGLSQWGAYGAAEKGWSAEQILTYYYSNTHLETRSGQSINISGYGVRTIDDYVAGLGEIPSRACGTLTQIQTWNDFANQQGWSTNDPRRNKYLLDNKDTPWDCWPEEAIKAQVIAARSYGITSAQPICTDARCQVYTGSMDKAWAAWETSNQFVVSHGYTHNGQIIRAFYSAYNSNGWGTADHATIWGANDGNTTSYSYLQSVKDVHFTYNYIFSRSAVIRTNSYSMNDLNNMLLWCSSSGNCSTSSWLKSNVVNKIGKLKSIQMINDASGRVKKVVLNGQLGSATTSGRYFRSIFNLWVEKVRPSGEIDKIPSISFAAKVVR